MRRKHLRFLRVMLLPLIAVFTMGNRCTAFVENPNSSPEQPSDERKVFEFEYDYMTGYNVFANGETSTRNAFSTCNTDLTIAYDEEIVPAVNIPWGTLTLLEYLADHSTLWPGEDSMDFLFKAHLLGMPDATTKPQNNNVDPFGVTYRLFDPLTSNDYMFSAIFVQAINNYGGDTLAMLKKTVIHELGHSRSRNNIPHSCEWDGGSNSYIVNSFHNDPACVMGMGRTNQCNFSDLTVNPHFCSACCEYLKKVTW